MNKRKLRMGMAGGGPGAFIGEVHRKAARLDGKIDIVAGAFDIDPEKSRAMGAELFVAPDRVYPDFDTLLAREKEREDAIDFVSITTPNKWHYPMARAALENGLHVVCEKPMTLTIEEAFALRDTAGHSGCVFALMHNYTGYPLVKLARDLVRAGDLGRILKVVVQYPQGWLSRPIEKDGNMQAGWRTDPKQSGIGGCVGDIGTHAAHLAEYVTGLEIESLCADLTTFVKDRPLNDDAHCLLRFRGGARGVLHASQISISELNNIALWVHGEQGSIEWHQEHPNQLRFTPWGRPTEIWERGVDKAYVSEKSPAAARATRVPSGHPEGFLEAFANIYLNFADTVMARMEGREPDPLALDFPGIEEGLRGMAFIQAMVNSATTGKWVNLSMESPG